MSDDFFRECLESAVASKQAGTAALQAGELRSAAFHYKKVYLHLAEYLPSHCSGGGGGASPSSGGGGVPDFLLAKGRQQQQQQPRGAALSAEDARAAYRVYGEAQNNLALACLKLGRFKEGAAAATQALRQREEEEAAAEAEGGAAESADGAAFMAKALLRRARCHAGLRAAQAAEADLARAETLLREAGLPPDAAVPQLRAELQAAAAHEKKKEKRMFQGMFAAATTEDKE